MAQSIYSDDNIFPRKDIGVYRPIRHLDYHGHIAQLGEGDSNGITESQTAIQYSELPATGDSKLILT
jgi:hypothetical protein